MSAIANSIDVFSTTNAKPRLLRFGVFGWHAGQSYFPPAVRFDRKPEFTQNLRRVSLDSAYKRLVPQRDGGFDMIAVMSGIALVVISCAAFLYFLPRQGKVNPMVENSNVGSMVTITIMTGFTIGLAIMFGGLFG